MHEKLTAVIWDFDGTLVDTRRKNMTVARALVEGDAYAARICRSRRYFYDRMTPQARALFGEAFAECEAAKKP